MWRILSGALLCLSVSLDAFSQSCNCGANSPNLLTNGDFEDTNTVATPPNYIGFESDYSSTDPIGNFGIFRRTTDASSILSIWCATPGANDYLIYDGTTGADAAVAPYDVLRYNNIAVAPGTTYKFSFDAMNLYAPGSFATLDVSVNGVPLGAVLVSNSCSWLTYEFCWTANTTQADLVINAGAGTQTGRDFALDNIYFGTCTAPSVGINDYAAVLAFTPCNNTITVDTADNFNVGDTILMIQMKGAVVDTSNTASFGNVLSYNSAGNYEYNTIAAKTGNNLQLTFALQRTYEIPAGKVQIVRVPHYQTYTVAQRHTAMPWNGAKGGVFAIIVDDTLTLNAPIDVTGTGFRGGTPTGQTSFSCDFTDYFYPATVNDAGLKGEGIAEVSAAKMRGRGRLANGGGGGNNTNSGGGGGSNGGAGGTGGRQWENCNVALNTGGVGGAGLNYNPLLNKIFAGGGGGVGQENNFDTDPGGNGGGIVVIKTGALAGFDSIIANGAHCVDVNSLLPSSGDGQSGGGGGGAIVIDAAAYAGSPYLVARGGNGGNVYATALHGPGAGGGGGAVLFGANALPVSQVILSGGANGVHVPTGDPHFAQPGTTGIVVNNIVLALPADSFDAQIDIDFKDSLVACNTIQFTDLSAATNSIASWNWSFGDGSTSGQQHPLHVYAAAGTYIVTLRVTDSTSCTDSLSKTIQTTGLNYTIEDTVVGCRTHRFTAVSADTVMPVTFRWDFGDGSPQDTTNPVVHTFTGTGAYNVTLYLTDSLGCSDTVAYGVFVAGVDAAFAVSDDTVCQGDIVSFVNSSSANSIFYAWNLGDGTTDSSISPTHQYVNAGVYYVSLITGNVSGCLDTARDTIIVDSIHTVDFVTSDSVLCEGRQIVFSSSFEDGSSTGYEWQFPGGVTVFNQNPVAQAFDTSGTFSVTATVHFRACPDATTTRTIEIQPFPRVDLGPDTFMCPYSAPVLLSDDINAGNGAAAWLWNTGETTSSIQARHPGIYTVRVSVNGCATDDSLEIFKDCYLDIPNAFTPNGDGVNDYFIPRQLLSRGLTTFKMTIFNRWGQVVFETAKTDGRGWDGKFNGVDQPGGVYVYLIEASFKSGTAEKYQGNLTLLR